MNRLRNSTLSSLGVRSFFMLRRMLVTQWKPGGAPAATGEDSLDQ